MATEKNKDMVRCIECKHGSYMQWFQNPIICNCQLYNEKFVAASRRVCPSFEKRAKTPEVTHFYHY